MELQPLAPSGSPPRAAARSVNSPCRSPRDGEVLVRTLYSGVSRGTETLVFRGGVPESQHARDARAVPGRRLPGTGEVRLSQRRGGGGRAGTNWSGVRCSACTRIRRVISSPSAPSPPYRTPCPPRGPCSPGPWRPPSTPCGTPRPWSGTGSPSSAEGWSAARWPRCSPASPACGSSSWTPTPPAPASPPPSASTSRSRRTPLGDCDLVVHASATEAGLARSLELLAPEGTVVELSWYGDRRVSLPLGEAFHSRRLTVRSSQVGTVSPRRAARTYADRLALALDLLADPAFDALITGECAFEELPDVMPALASGETPALCHRVRYPGAADLRAPPARHCPTGKGAAPDLRKE